MRVEVFPKEDNGKRGRNDKPHKAEADTKRADSRAEGMGKQRDEGEYNKHYGPCNRCQQNVAEKLKPPGKAE